MNTLNVNLIDPVATGLLLVSLAGFMLMDSGFNRLKNAGNNTIRNLVVLAGSSLAFLLVGFGLMHGGSSPWLGWFDLGAQAAYPDSPALMIGFQLIASAFAARIFLGATAERMKFPATILFGILFAALVYPVAGKWSSMTGWLGQLGFYDESGASWIHLAGGASALAGSILTGSRQGKFGSKGESRVILGSSTTLLVLGVFLIWAGWPAFALARLASGEMLPAAFGQTNLNFMLSALAATLASMCASWLRHKKPDFTLTLNGTLSGLVALSAGGSTMTRTGAIVIGILAGACVVGVVEILDKQLRIDDPAGAIAVHGAGGSIGLLSIGLLSTRLDANGIPVGLLYGGSFKTLLVQVLGLLAILIWSGLASGLLLKTIDRTLGLRVTHVDEINGLDLEIHGLSTPYSEAILASDSVFAMGGSFDPAPHNVPAESSGDLPDPAADTYTIPTRPDGSPRMTLITMIIRQNKFEPLKAALNAIGVTGMTVTQVAGCGMQKGDKEFYRGIPVDIQLLPKVKVEVVVCKVPVDLVIKTVRHVLYTGFIGDGKVFISEIDRVLKVRTGEEDFDALQDAIY